MFLIRWFIYFLMKWLANSILKKGEKNNINLSFTSWHDSKFIFFVFCTYFPFYTHFFNFCLYSFYLQIHCNHRHTEDFIWSLKCRICRIYKQNHNSSNIQKWIIMICHIPWNPVALWWNQSRVKKKYMCHKMCALLEKQPPVPKWHTVVQLGQRQVWHRIWLVVRQKKRWWKAQQFLCFCVW